MARPFPSSALPCVQWPASLASGAAVLLLALCLSLLACSVEGVKSVTKASFLYLPVPYGVSVDAAGDVYGLVGVNGSVVKWSSAGKLLSTSSPLGIVGSLQGLVVDSCGNEYIGGEDDQAVYKVSAAGQLSLLATPPPDASLIYVPSLWVDSSSGRVYVADRDNSVVVVFDHNGLVLSYIATNLYYPIAVAADTAGNIYVVNSNSDSVFKLDPTGATVLQTFDTSNPSLTDPTGLAVDSKGNVYVADQGNNRLVQFSPAGAFTVVFSVPSTPLGNWLGQVALDACGAVYVTDPYNLRIVKFTVNTTCTDTAAASIPAYCTEPSPFTYYHMPTPSGVAVDASGNVHGLNLNEGSIVTFAQSTTITAISFFDTDDFRGQSLSLDGCGTAYIGTNEGRLLQVLNGETVLYQIPYGANEGQLIQPGVPYVDGNGSVYVPDSYNDAVFVLNYQGILASTIHLQNVVGSPSVVARDSAGDLYLLGNAYAYDPCVYKVSANGAKLLHVFNTTGPELSEPAGLVVDSNGHVFVSDTGNSRVVEFDSDGAVVSILVTPYPFLGQTGQLALDACNNVYVVDYDNNRIVKFILNATCTVPTVSSKPAYCSAPSPFAYYYMPSPAGVAVDLSGVLHGLNGRDGSVVAFTASGAKQVSYSFSSVATDYAGTLVIDACGQQYIYGNGQLWKANGSVVSAVQLPAADFGLDSPTGLWSDLNGTVYVGDDVYYDGNGYRVVRFSAYTAPQTVVAVDYNPLGVATDSKGNIYYITDSSTDVFVVSAAGVLLNTLTAYNNPPTQLVSVAVDRSGNVFVADSEYGVGGRILQLNSSGAVVATFYTPYPDLGTPSQIALDACGNVYAADEANSRIVEFILHPTCSNAAIAAAQPAVCSAPAPYVYYSMPNPTGVAVDRNGNVYGLDGNNGGIIQFPVKGGVTAAYPLPVFTGYTTGLTIDGCGQQYVSDVENEALWKINGSAVAEFGLNSNGASFLNVPGPSWVDSKGFVYLTDSDNTTITKFDQSGAVVAVFAPEVGGPLTSVATNSAGDLYVAFESPVILELSPTGQPKAYLQNDVASGFGQLYPGGLTVDRYGNLYVSDQTNDCVVQYNSKGVVVAAHFTPPPFLSGPTQVAVDLCGNLYVVDPGNSRIVQIVTNATCSVAAQPFTAPSFCPAAATVSSSSSSSTGGVAATHKGATSSSSPSTAAHTTHVSSSSSSSSSKK